MAAYYSAKDVAALNHGREKVHEQFEELRQRYILRNYKSEHAQEYAMHGFGRRLGTLVRTIDQVFEALPPEREDIPERDDVVDATIAIQSFVFNTFGCLDNLAWIWVHEKDVKAKDGGKLEPLQVGLSKDQIRRSFSSGFLAYLDSRKEWFDHIKDFRDALAHRIPLYIPPYVVTPQTVGEYNKIEQASAEAMQLADFKEYDRLQSEQEKLGTFRPLMIHSFYEQTRPIAFHPQLLADYNTIDELGQKMLAKLDR